MLSQQMRTTLFLRRGRNMDSMFRTAEISNMLMWCDSPFSHQLVAKWPEEDEVGARVAPHPLRDTSVLIRTLWGQRFTTLPFHVDRPWHHSFRSWMVALESLISADQLNQQAMSL
jgi:hypothetical protein